MAACFLVFALWGVLQNVHRFEELYVMPDHWYATVASTKGIRKEALNEIKELVGTTTLVTLADVNRIARRDAEECEIAKNKTRPGVKALLAKR